MRYFVLGDQGQKYGPADIQTLSGWIAEGRLLPTTMLEDEASGMRSAASAVSGLQFPVVPPPAAPTYGSGPSYNPAATGGVPYTPPAYKSDEGVGGALLGIGLGFLSIVVTFFIGIFGLLCWTSGIAASWRVKDERPALAWIGIAINGCAAAFWIYWRFVHVPGT